MIQNQNDDVYNYWCTLFKNTLLKYEYTSYKSRGDESILEQIIERCIPSMIDEANTDDRIEMFIDAFGDFKSKLLNDLIDNSNNKKLIAKFCIKKINQI
jgi:hypothetical protein